MLVLMLVVMMSAAAAASRLAAAAALTLHRKSAVIVHGLVGAWADHSATGGIAPRRSDISHLQFARMFSGPFGGRLSPRISLTSC
jgi:hypothetical protein